MTNSKQKVWNLLHKIFKIKIFEKLLLPFTKDKFADTRMGALPPRHYMYDNPTFREAKKNNLRLLANLHDFNDWKAYWGLKETEREHLYTLAEKAKTVIDVGTNNGWVLMNIASLIKKNDGFIYGFEPHPETYKRCVENINRSNITNCKIFNMGCSDVEGKLIMSVIDETNSGQNRIIETAEASDRKKVEVHVTTLDKQLLDINKIDLIKIDVEGFELHVLKGADKIIKKNRPVFFIEIDDALLKANHTSPKEVLDFLTHEYNYTIKSAATIKPLNESSLDNCHLDIICYPS